MDITKANQIKEKFLQDRDQRKQKEYLSAIRNYAKFILEDPTSPYCVGYIFDILRDAGYLGMMGFHPDPELSERMAKVFDIEISDDNTSTPMFIDFEDLFYETTRYAAMAEELQERMPNSPQLGEDAGNLAIWDDMWWELEDCGLGLILKAYDIIAVRHGFKQILTRPDKIRGWRNSWENFIGNSEAYLKELCECETCFHPFSDNIFKISARFPCMADEMFRSFVLNVTAPRETDAKARHYRRIFSPDEAKEIYYHTKLRFQDYPSAAWIYFYKAALAEQTLKKFIMTICQAKDQGPDISGKRDIVTSSDGEFAYDVPVIRAGNKEYSVHVLNNTRVGDWGIRKDRMAPFLKAPDFQGALFCWMAEYPSGSILVRFESYVEKERLEALLGQKEEVFKNFVRLSFGEVYEDEQREAFLQIAAEAVMGISDEKDEAIQEESEIDEILKTLIRELTILSSTAGDFVRNNQSFFIPDASRLQNKEEDDPESNCTEIEMVFPDQEEKISFLELELDSPEQEKKIQNLKEVLDYNPNWKFIAFCAEGDNPVRQHLDTPENFSDNEEVELDISPNTRVVLIAFGPEDEISQLQSAFEGEPAPDGEHRIYWAIYKKS